MNPFAWRKSGREPGAKKSPVRPGLPCPAKDRSLCTHRRSQQLHFAQQSKALADCKLCVLVLVDVLERGLIGVGAHGALTQHELAVSVADGQVTALLVRCCPLTHLPTQTKTQIRMIEALRTRGGMLSAIRAGVAHERQRYTRYTRGSLHHAPSWAKRKGMVPEHNRASLPRNRTPVLTVELQGRSTNTPPPPSSFKPPSKMRPLF